MKVLTVFRCAVKNWRAFSTKTDAVLKSKLPDVNIPNIAVHEYVFRNINRWQNRTAVVCQQTGRSYKYHELMTKSQSVATFFRKKLKLQRDDTIAIVMPNVPEYPIVIFAASFAGLKATTVNPDFNIEEITKQLVQSEAKVVVTLSAKWSFISKAILALKHSTPTIVLRHEKHDYLPRGSIDFMEISHYEKTDLEAINSSNTFLLPYSSGTTGLPKGVELTHTNIVANLVQTAVPEIRLYRETDGDLQDVIPIFLPIFHIYGMVTMMMTMLAGGCKIITVPKFGKNELLQVLEIYKPTIMNLVPPIIHLINKDEDFTSQQLESLRIVMCGAAPLGALDVKAFQEKTKERIPLVQGYGMTETSPAIIFQSATMENGIKDGGIGFIIPNTECKVVAVDNSEAVSLGPHQSGELYVKGPQVMKGYYKNKKATKDTMTKNEFLKTGDIVYYDEDEHFFLTDRSKELIKVKGFQVAPAELEIILRQYPDVQDAAVVGVPHPKTGEAPRAFIVVKQGSLVVPEAIKSYVANKVANYKNLNGGVAFIDRIPRNPSGKILRKELKNI